jgi:nucleoside-diphosphate-sugar epimerase
MKVLVTGATGFLGSRVVAGLLAAQDHVIALRRPQTPAPPSMSTVACDLADTARVHEILETHRPDAVLHLAWFAKHPAYWSAPENLDSVAHSMSLLRLAAAAGCRRFVGAGTCAEYDWSHPRLVERITPCVPRTLYGTAKLAVATVGERYAATAGLSFAWARYNFLFGPGPANGRLVSSAIASFTAGQDFACSTGDQIRDFQHVDDAASATISLLHSDVTGPVNIGSGQPVSVRSVIETLSTLIGGAGRPLIGALPTRADEPSALVPELTRLGTEVGWRQTARLRDRLASVIPQHRSVQP